MFAFNKNLAMNCISLSLLRRKVALQYMELTQRELEYVALSRDTTEADLKQRREIQNSTATYFDQVCINHATVYYSM